MTAIYFRRVTRPLHAAWIMTAAAERASCVDNISSVSSLFSSVPGREFFEDEATEVPGGNSCGADSLRRLLASVRRECSEVWSAVLSS